MAGNLSRRATGDLPAGCIIPFAGQTAPDGWLLCNGSTYSRTTYVSLFDNIGTAWGNGNGSTTFNVPDLRGYHLRGQDHGAGRDPDAGSRTASNPGGAVGDNVGSVQPHGYENHNHTLGTTQNPGGVPGTYGATAGAQSFVFGYIGGGNGNASSETRPLNANVNYIIKY